MQKINRIKWFFSLEGMNVGDNIILFISKCIFAVQATLFYHSLSAAGVQQLIEKFTFPSPIIIKTRYAFFVRVTRMFEYILFTRGYEPETMKCLPINGKITFIDVGANYGVYTLYVASRNSSSTVIAIEPYHKTYDALIANVKLNNYSNVKCINCAAWDTDNSTINLYLNKDSIANPSVVGSAKDFVPVQARTIDSIVTENGLSKVNWLKIDVESAETFVLKGAEQALKVTDNVLLEVHSKENGIFCERMLREMGFKIEILWQRGEDYYHIHAYK